MSTSLKGILVVSLEHAVAAPYTSSRLADAGARVIKIERPGGDFARDYDSIVNGQSAYFVWLNRGKESIELNIKTADEAALLHRMIDRADVFIQNLGPGAAKRLGFDSAELRMKHPRLITCDISGYGEQGPYRDKKAYDLLVQAETGLASITGSPDAPGRVGVSICDIAVGMTACVGILEALFERERSGQGKALKISMFDCMADWMTVPFLYQEYTGVAPPRVGLSHPSIAPYGAYPVDKGELVIIGVQNHAEWICFCEKVLNKPELVDDPRFSDNEKRVQNSAALDTEIKTVFAGLGRQELIAGLHAANIAYGFVNSVADLCKHPQLRRVSVPIPGAQTELIAPPVIVVDEQTSLGPVPSLGEHTQRLWKEFGEQQSDQPEKMYEQTQEVLE